MKTRTPFPSQTFWNFPSLTHLSVKIMNIEFHPYLALPPSLTHLTIRAELTGNINQLFFFPNITHLKIISQEFNQPVDYLPKNLQALCIFGRFNKPVDKLPSGRLSFLKNQSKRQLSLKYKGLIFEFRPGSIFGILFLLFSDSRKLIFGRGLKSGPFLVGT